MAARLSLDERVFVESSLGAGRSVADAAQRLGRDPVDGASRAGPLRRAGGL